MIFVVTILIIIPIFFLYRIGPMLPIAYVVFLYFFLPITSYFILPSVAYRIFFPINIAILVLFILHNFNGKGVSHFDLGVVFYIPIFLLTVGIASASTGQNVIQDIYFFRNHFFNLLIFSLVYSLKRKEAISLAKIVCLCFFVELVLGVAQSQSESISELFEFDYVLKDGINQARLNYEEGAKIVTGTFLAMSNMSNALVFFAVILIMYFKEIENNILTVIFILLSIVVVALSGIRSSLGAFLIITALFVAYKKPFLLLVLLVPVFFIYQIFAEEISILGQLASNNTFGFSNPLLRLAGLLSIFNSTDSDQLLTFGRTIDLASQYDLSMPFGNGTNLTYEGYDSPTDAYLMTMLVDYGWVIFLLLIFPYLGILFLLAKSASRNDAIKMGLSLLLLIILTTVDEGLWYQVANFLFVLTCGLVMAIGKKSKEELLAPELKRV